MKFINRKLNDANKIVFIDFEGTQLTQEIIAIGAVKAELDAKKNIKKFDKGFRIYIYTDSKIGSIIEDMTGIDRPLLNAKGVDFETGIRKLQKYIGEDLTFTKFMTFGTYDARLIKNTASLYEMEDDPFIVDFLQKNIDFSAILNTFVRSDKNESLSLSNACKLYNITPYGRHHDPKSDAFNESISSIYNSKISYQKRIHKSFIKWPTS